MPSERSAGVVVFDKESKKYLLLRYKSGHWDFSKGLVEKGESDLQAALRELKEETGLKDVEVIENFTRKINYFYKFEGKTVFKEVIFFLVTTKTNKVKISWEHIGHKWLGYENAVKKITYNNSRRVLKAANERIIQLFG